MWGYWQKTHVYKQIKSIQTDSTPLEEPKNPDTCNVYSLYKLLANEEQNSAMRANYEGGNYGYGHAKQALFDLIISKSGNILNIAILNPNSGSPVISTTTITPSSQPVSLAFFSECNGNQNYTTSFNTVNVIKIN